MRRVLNLALAMGLALSTGAFAQNAGNGPRGGDKDGDGRCDVCGKVTGERQCQGKGRQGKGRGIQRMGRGMMNRQHAPAVQQN